MSFKGHQPITLGSGVRFISGFGRFKSATGTVTVTTGAVTAITITDPGEGYISSTDATVTIAGDGTSATATATLGNGFIVFVPVSSAGKGYSASNPPAVTFSGGGGSGAKARAVVGANGSIEKIVIDDPGSGYTSVPTASIAAAGGSGSNATLGTVQGCFQITGATVTAGGSGYTQAATIVTFGNPRQAILSLGFTNIMGVNIHTYDDRAIASGESVQVVWPGVGNRNSGDPTFTSAAKSSRRAQVVIQRTTTSTYSAGLLYQAQIYGR